jgi:hypothetical protein
VLVAGLLLSLSSAPSDPDQPPAFAAAALQRSKQVQDKRVDVWPVFSEHAQVLKNMVASIYPARPEER